MDAALQTFTGVERGGTFLCDSSTGSGHRYGAVRVLARGPCDESTGPQPCHRFGDREEGLSLVRTLSGEQIVVFVPLIGGDEVVEDGQTKLVDGNPDHDFGGEV